jgi:hypothetical protein
MRSICIEFALCLHLAGCINTEGNLKLEGKIIDESTKIQIPGRDVIIQGLLKHNNNIVPIDAGQFSTDSTGVFKYTLKRIKDIRYYNFCIVGDSDYVSVTYKLSLTQLKESSKYLFFSVNKLVDLTINIQKTSKVAYLDTIYLKWESNNADFRTLYPYKVDNYGITGNTFALLDYFGLRWIGENINSTIKTKVFADKLTLIHWELVSNRMRKEITDTIICKRDSEHTVSFVY